MITVRVPFRISLFGGSTDYRSFYQKHGSFLIGGTIDKYIYMSMRFRPKFFPRENYLVYSKMEYTKDLESIQNPLIREILKYKDVKDYIEFTCLSDVKSISGLGGSSSFCVGMLGLINELYGMKIDKKELVRDAIKIERELLGESGGIQDHIWPVYGGFNSIEINKNGDFFVKPIPVTQDFLDELEESIILIYVEGERNKDVASKHEVQNKIGMLEIAEEAYSLLVKENISEFGKLLYESWLHKKKISEMISNPVIDEVINKVMDWGSYGAKLLGSGGTGFVCCICNSLVKNKILSEFGDKVLDFKFENKGLTVLSKF